MTGLYVTPGRAGSPFVGVQRRLTTPAPAPGAEWQLVLPGGSWWHLLTGRGQFTASVAVANRFPGIALLDGSAILNRSGSVNAVAAGATVDVNYVTAAPIVLDGGNGGRPSMALPDIIIPAGYILRSHTIALDAADQYSAIEWLWEEIDQGPYGGGYGYVEAVRSFIGGQGE